MVPYWCCCVVRMLLPTYCTTEDKHDLQDLMTNPLIVPVKILRGHTSIDHEGICDCVFHPTQPWVFTAGADSTICLFTN